MTSYEQAYATTTNQLMDHGKLTIGMQYMFLVSIQLNKTYMVG